MDIQFTFKNLLQLAYVQAKALNGSFQLFFPFAYRGKQCILAMYSHGYSGSFTRNFWPCLYIETDKRGLDYQMRCTPNVHGNITYGSDTMPESGFSQHFVGCDWNHSRDTRNTFEDDLHEMEETLEGLYQFTTTPDDILYRDEKRYLK